MESGAVCRAQDAQDAAGGVSKYTQVPSQASLAGAQNIIQAAVAALPARPAALSNLQGPTFEVARVPGDPSALDVRVITGFRAHYPAQPHGLALPGPSPAGEVSTGSSIMNHGLPGPIGHLADTTTAAPAPTGPTDMDWDWSAPSNQPRADITNDACPSHAAAQQPTDVWASHHSLLVQPAGAPVVHSSPQLQLQSPTPAAQSPFAAACDAPWSVSTLSNSATPSRMGSLRSGPAVSVLAPAGSSPRALAAPTDDTLVGSPTSRGKRSSDGSELHPRSPRKRSSMDLAIVGAPSSTPHNPTPACMGAASTAHPADLTTSHAIVLTPPSHHVLGTSAPPTHPNAHQHGRAPDSLALTTPQQAGPLTTVSPPGKEWELDMSNITVIRRLAVGGFAEVFLGRYQGTLVAIKRLIDSYPETLGRFAHEVRVLMRLRHPNLILFMGYILRPDLCIVSEYMSRGSLYGIIRARASAGSASGSDSAAEEAGLECAGNMGEGARKLPRPLEAKLQRAVAVAVARGMAYLHTRNPPILHLDLKSPNILVDNAWRIKIADFGLSVMRKNTMVDTAGPGGTPEWMAPEVLRCEPYNEKADVYSYGVVLWELLTGQAPWHDLQPLQVVGWVGFQGHSLEVPTMGDPVLTDLCQRCLNRDPALRPAFTDIVSQLDAAWGGQGSSGSAEQLAAMGLRVPEPSAPPAGAPTPVVTEPPSHPLHAMAHPQLDAHPHWVQHPAAAAMMPPSRCVVEELPVGRQESQEEPTTSMGPPPRRTPTSLRQQPIIEEPSESDTLRCSTGAASLERSTGSSALPRDPSVASMQTGTSDATGSSQGGARGTSMQTGTSDAMGSSQGGERGTSMETGNSGDGRTGHDAGMVHQQTLGMSISTGSLPVSQSMDMQGGRSVQRDSQAWRHGPVLTSMSDVSMAPAEQPANGQGLQFGDGAASGSPAPQQQWGWGPGRREGVMSMDGRSSPSLPVPGGGQGTSDRVLVSVGSRRRERSPVGSPDFASLLGHERAVVAKPSYDALQAPPSPRQQVRLGSPSLRREHSDQSLTRMSAPARFGTQGSPPAGDSPRHSDSVLQTAPRGTDVPAQRSPAQGGHGGPQAQSPAAGRTSPLSARFAPVPALPLPNVVVRLNSRHRRASSFSAVSRNPVLAQLTKARNPGSSLGPVQGSPTGVPSSEQVAPTGQRDSHQSLDGRPGPSPLWRSSSQEDPGAARHMQGDLDAAVAARRDDAGGAGGQQDAMQLGDSVDHQQHEDHQQQWVQHCLEQGLLGSGDQQNAAWQHNRASNGVVYHRRVLSDHSSAHSAGTGDSPAHMGVCDLPGHGPSPADMQAALPSRLVHDVVCMPGYARSSAPQHDSGLLRPPLPPRSSAAQADIPAHLWPAMLHSHRLTDASLDHPRPSWNDTASVCTDVTLAQSMYGSAPSSSGGANTPMSLSSFPDFSFHQGGLSRLMHANSSGLGTSYGADSVLGTSVGSPSARHWERYEAQMQSRQHHYQQHLAQRGPSPPPAILAPCGTVPEQQPAQTAAGTGSSDHMANAAAAAGPCDLGVRQDSIQFEGDFDWSPRRMQQASGDRQVDPTRPGTAATGEEQAPAEPMVVSRPVSPVLPTPFSAAAHQQPFAAGQPRSRPPLPRPAPVSIPEGATGLGAGRGSSGGTGGQDNAMVSSSMGTTPTLQMECDSPDVEDLPGVSEALKGAAPIRSWRSGRFKVTDFDKPSPPPSPHDGTRISPEARRSHSPESHSPQSRSPGSASGDLQAMESGLHLSEADSDALMDSRPTGATMMYRKGRFFVSSTQPAFSAAKDLSDLVDGALHHLAYTPGTSLPHSTSPATSPETTSPRQRVKFAADCHPGSATATVDSTVQGLLSHVQGTLPHAQGALDAAPGSALPSPGMQRSQSVQILKQRSYTRGRFNVEESQTISTAPSAEMPAEGALSPRMSGAGCSDAPALARNSLDAAACKGADTSHASGSTRGSVAGAPQVSQPQQTGDACGSLPSHLTVGSSQHQAQAAERSQAQLQPAGVGQPQPAKPQVTTKVGRFTVSTLQVPNGYDGSAPSSSLASHSSHGIPTSCPSVSPGTHACMEEGRGVQLGDAQVHHLKTVLAAHVGGSVGAGHSSQGDSGGACTPLSSSVTPQEHTAAGLRVDALQVPGTQPVGPPVMAHTGGSEDALHATHAASERVVKTTKSKGRFTVTEESQVPADSHAL